MSSGWTLPSWAGGAGPAPEPPPPATEGSGEDEPAGPDFQYARDTLQIEETRLIRAIRRLEEMPFVDVAAQVERRKQIDALQSRVDQLVDAYNVLDDVECGRDPRVSESPDPS